MIQNHIWNHHETNPRNAFTFFPRCAVCMVYLPTFTINTSYMAICHTLSVWLRFLLFFFRICFSHLEILWKSCQKSKAAIADYGKHVAGFLCWSFLWMYEGWVKSHFYHSSPYIIYMWCAIVIVLRGKYRHLIYWGYILFIKETYVQFILAVLSDQKLSFGDEHVS